MDHKFLTTNPFIILSPLWPVGFRLSDSRIVGVQLKETNALDDRAKEKKDFRWNIGLANA